MAATSPTPPSRTATRKSFCVTLVPALPPVASRKLLCFPLRTTAHKAMPTATLRRFPPMDASWLSAPPPPTLLPTLPQAARFICATPAPAPPRNAHRKRLLSPQTNPACSLATIICFPQSVRPGALWRLFPTLPQNIPRSLQAMPIAVIVRYSSAILVLAPPPPAHPPPRASRSSPGTPTPCKPNPPAQPSPVTHKPSACPALPHPLFSPAPSP